MRIAILTPTFNSLAHLRGCVASIRAQAVSGTALSNHHRIHDACSTDGTPEFLDGHGGKADGYRLAYRVEADEGMYDALNRAFAATDGEIVGHLNLDEQYLPGTLEFIDGFFRDHPAIDVWCATLGIIEISKRWGDWK